MNITFRSSILFGRFWIVNGCSEVTWVIAEVWDSLMFRLALFFNYCWIKSRKFSVSWYWLFSFLFSRRCLIEIDWSNMSFFCSVVRSMYNFNVLYSTMLHPAVCRTFDCQHLYILLWCCLCSVPHSKETVSTSHAKFVKTSLFFRFSKELNNHDERSISFFSALQAQRRKLTKTGKARWRSPGHDWIACVYFRRRHQKRHDRRCMAFWRQKLEENGDQGYDTVSRGG